MTVISISGRKGSGKSTLANILIKKGFKRVSFADRLKFLVATLYSWDLDRMGELNYKEEMLSLPVLWNISSARTLESMIEAPEGCLFWEERLLCSRREALQYIGTEILRKYDVDFHVKSLIASIIPLENYVLDDTRFPNELKALRDINATCIFVIRPAYFDFSNHASEVMLTRHDFELILLNDMSLPTLIKSGEWFFNTTLASTPPKISRSELIALIGGRRSAEVAFEQGCSRDKIVWWARKHLVRLEDRNYVCDDEAFSQPTCEAAYWAGLLSADGCIKCSGSSRTSMMVELSSIDYSLVHGFQKFLKTNKPIFTQPPEKRGITSYPSTKTSYTLGVHSSLIVDDIKLWNLRPRKGVNNELPYIALSNEDCMKSWYVGLIDGDGSIFITKQGRLIISLLGSLPVLQYLSEWSNLPHSSITQEKKVEGLYHMRFAGKNAKALAEKLNFMEMGLPRKWNKIKGTPSN